MPLQRLYALAVFFLAPCLIQAQTAAPLTYAVVSIHQTVGMEEMGWRPMTFTPAGALAENAPLADIVRTAFARSEEGPFLKDRLIGPAWIDQARFNIRANLDPADMETYKQVSADRKRQMLLDLLVDRFRLKYHREPRAFTQYALVVAKGGPKLTPAKLSTSPQDNPAFCHFPNGRGQTLTYRPMEACSMDDFARDLSGWLDARVINKTEIIGKYDITLGWDESTMGGRPTGTAPHPGMQELSLFDALPQQLGLKLVPAKVTLDVVIIDHIEKPAEN